METVGASAMRKNRASRLEPHAPDPGPGRDRAELAEIARRGMRANADFMNLLRDQATAHRLAAARSTLPRVQAHRSALADHLEGILDTEGHLPRLPASMPGA